MTNNDEPGPPTTRPEPWAEAIIFVGLQGAGKSTFYKERFFNTHLRVNLDMLRTRHRERILLRACIEMQSPFVVDNTNPTVADRAGYIALAKEAGYRVIGYSFATTPQECARRNAARAEAARVPRGAIWGTHKRLQGPTLAEGFDTLYVVRPDGAGGFAIEEWPGEV